jgi:hypothetical protein
LPDIDASAVRRHGRRVCTVLRTGECADSKWSERQSDTILYAGAIAVVGAIMLELAEKDWALFIHAYK